MNYSWISNQIKRYNILHHLRYSNDLSIVNDILSNDVILDDVKIYDVNYDILTEDEIKTAYTIAEVMFNDGSISWCVNTINPLVNFLIANILINLHILSGKFINYNSYTAKLSDIIKCLDVVFYGIDVIYSAMHQSR